MLVSSREKSHKPCQKLPVHKISQRMTIFCKLSHHFTNCIKIYCLCPQFPILQYSKDALLRDDLSNLPRDYGKLFCKVPRHVNSLTTKGQTTKFSSANFQNKKKHVKSKLYHTKNSKTRGQTV